VIAFATLLLGLVLGPQQVDLVVEGDAARVELLVDGESAGEDHEAPWSIRCDLGPDLHPHRLEVVAWDAAGNELGRATQWVNLPRSRAEAAFVLEGEDPQRPERVRLIWEHIEYAAAQRVVVRLDGEPLPFETTDRIPLPELDPGRLHTLEAELVFPDGTRYQAELAFSGRLGGDADIQLTGLTYAHRRRSLPALDRLGGWVAVDGRPLTVRGIERAPGKVVFVIDHSAIPALRQLAPFGEAITTPETAMRQGEVVEFLFPYARMTEAHVGGRLFTISQPFPASGASFAQLATRVAAPEPTERRRVTDAVAVAAVQAASESRPRAVVLVLGHEDEDTSAYRVEEVLRFLGELRVPLHVWWTGRPQSRTISEDRRPVRVETPWGSARDISSVTRIVAASQLLRQTLDEQITLWVEGLHLPHEVEITSQAKGLELPSAPR